MDQAEIDSLLERVPEEHMELISALKNTGTTVEGDGGKALTKAFNDINDAQITIPMEGMRPALYEGIYNLPRAAIRVTVSPEGLLSVKYAA